MTKGTNSEFELRGVNHLALVCRDMAKTVEFYRDVLGMPLTKTIDLPNGMGQHFFFDMGGGNALAFFWFPDAPAAAPGVAAPSGLPGIGSLVTAHGSMNHIAFDVPAERFDEYCERLTAKGIKLSPVMNHDDSPAQVAASMHPGVFVRSVYFFDPDGVCLEFAAWTRALTDADVCHDPVGADGEKVEGVILKQPAPAVVPAE
jgi:catechol 2,3-dioxygenase-like lactoylglutathione lyase family enzyme